MKKEKRIRSRERGPGRDIQGEAENHRERGKEKLLAFGIAKVAVEELKSLVIRIADARQSTQIDCRYLALLRINGMNGKRIIDRSTKVCKEK